MIYSLPYLILFFFLSGCYNSESLNLSPPDIENIPNQWEKKEYQSDYNIEKIFPIKSDSSLYYLLNEFSQNNKDVLLLDLNKKISQINYKIENSTLYPEISINSSFGSGKQNFSSFGLDNNPFNSSDNNEEGGDGEGEEDSSLGFSTSSNSLNLNASWELDVWSRLKNGEQAAYYNMKSDFYDIIYAENSLKAQFIKLYLKGVALNKQILISEKNLNNLSKLKKISKERSLKGISGHDEVHIASANYYLYESQLFSLKDEYKNLLSNIDLILGRYLKSGAIVAYQYPNEIFEIKSEISTNLLERRPDVLSAREKLSSSKFKLKSDEKIFFPNITLSASAGYSSSELTRLISDDLSVWNIGVNIFEPIFNAGKFKNNIKASEYFLEASEIEYMKIAINAIYEVDRIIQKDASLKKVYLKISQSKSDMQRAVDYALNSYELGLVDLIYLLNIQDKLYNISIQENKVLLDRYMNGVDLILSLGGSFEYE